MKFNKVLKNLSTYEAGKPIELVVREYGIDPKIKSHIVEGNSIFFIDFDGHKDDENVKRVLEKHKNSVKILGSYVKEVNDI